MKKHISTKNAPAAIGTYSQAIQAGSFLYISGQIPLVANSMEIVSQDFEKQAEQVFKNLQGIVTEAGGSMRDIIKLNFYVTDLSNFAVLNDIMSKFFEAPYPARAAVEVSALPKGVAIEADAVAHLDAL